MPLIDLLVRSTVLRMASERERGVEGKQKTPPPLPPSKTCLILGETVFLETGLVLVLLFFSPAPRPNKSSTY